MPLRVLLVLFLLSASPILKAQSEAPPRYQIYGGYTFLSNSFNGVPGSEQPLNGWDAAVSFPGWHGLRFKIDVFGYHGTNLGAPQNAFFILAGGQYDWQLRRERIYVHGLMGDAGLNHNWGPGGIAGETASFAGMVGGGLDTPVAKHFAIRVDGDYLYSYFALSGNLNLPYRIPGLPTNFGRMSSGLVWQF